MDKKQAYQLLVDATAQLTANRDVHIKIQQALDVIKVLVEEPKKSSPTK